MDAIELIEKLGGISAVADLVGIKPPSVSGWKEKNRIPDDKLMRLGPIAESRGIVTRKELFPKDWQDIWPELVKAEKISPIVDDKETALLMAEGIKAGVIKDRRVADKERREVDRFKDAELETLRPAEKSRQIPDV